MSGNGIRCFAQALAARRGDLVAAADPHRRRRRAASSCPPPTTRTRSSPASTWARSADSPSPAGWDALGADPDRPVTHLSLGNPHSVVGVDDVAAVDLARARRQAAARQPRDRRGRPDVDAITMRVHERGAGITEACGTGACAAAYAAAPVGSGDAARRETRGAHGRRKCNSDSRFTSTGQRHAHRADHLHRHDRSRSSPTVEADRDVLERAIHGTDELSPHHTPYSRSARRHAHRPRRPGAIVLVGVTFPGVTDDDTDASLDELAAARRHRRRRRGRRAWCNGATPRPHLVHRQGQGRGAEAALPRRRRRHRRVRQRAGAGPAVQPREAARAHGHRPHGGDPRHLRPERPHARGQGPGRAGAAASTGCRACAAAPSADSPSSAAASAPASAAARPSSRSTAGAILRRISQARGRPQGAGAARAPAAQAARPQRPRHRRDRRLHQRRQVERCSTALTDAGVLAEDRLFATLDPDHPPAGAARAASRCCSPTPSASSAACRTAWSRPSRARSRSPPTPTTWCTSSTPAPPTRSARSTPCATVLGEIGADRCPSCWCSTRPTSRRVEAKQLALDHPGSVAISAVTGEGIDDLLRHARRPTAVADRRRRAFDPVRPRRRARRGAPRG